MKELVKQNTIVITLGDVEKYIMGTLLFTPRYSIMNRTKAVDIKVYKYGDQQPSMKIFRMFYECIEHSKNPEGKIEFAFQDEVNILTENGMDTMNRWQVNFSVYFDKETYEFYQIDERPESLQKDFFKSLEVFNSISKIKGSVIYAGDLSFISDGYSWIPSDRKGNVLLMNEVASLMPWIN